MRTRVILTCQSGKLIRAMSFYINALNVCDYQTGLELTNLKKAEVNHC